MHPFQYAKIKSNDQAFSVSGARFLGGGTTLIDLMKLEVETPQILVDVNGLPLNTIEKLADGGVKIGATVKNADLSQHEYIKSHYSVLSQALLSGASPQLRNKATTAGNLLQRTRCVYFRDTSKACNKRKPKSGCAAIEGMNRNLAILGTSNSCIATNPSDMNVAMMALEAKVHLQSKEKTREVPISEFYLLPGDTPEKETVLEQGELITGVTIAALPQNTKSVYLKLRDRASYEFALASAAVVMTKRGTTIERVRIAMGGIGTRPWRSAAAEKILEGAVGSPEKFTQAANELLRGAKPQKENGFKVELAKRCLINALQKATQA